MFGGLFSIICISMCVQCFSHCCVGHLSRQDLRLPERCCSLQWQPVWTFQNTAESQYNGITASPWEDRDRKTETNIKASKHMCFFTLRCIRENAFHVKSPVLGKAPANTSLLIFWIPNLQTKIDLEVAFCFYGFLSWIITINGPILQ